MIIFLSVSLNMCFWCSEEPSHRDGSFEYPQHMFWLRNKENNFQLHTLIWGSDHGSFQLFFLFKPESMSIQKAGLILAPNDDGPLKWANGPYPIQIHANF